MNFFFGGAQLSIHSFSEFQKNFVGGIIPRGAQILQIRYNDFLILKSNKYKLSQEKIASVEKLSNINYKIPKIDYKYNIKEEYKINNLKGCNEFYIPEITDIYNSLYNTSINNNINLLIYNNDKIKFNIFKQIEIYADGNCYYRALSKFMTNTEIYHPFFRNVIYNYIKDNKNKFLEEDSYVDYLEHNII